MRKKLPGRIPISWLAKKLNLQTDMGLAALQQAIENVQLLDRKQHDYGSRNISDFGSLGCLVRANDKIQRLKNLQGKVAKNESIVDSWSDLSNYALIAMLIEKGIWR